MAMSPGGFIVTITGNVVAAPRFIGSDRYSVFGFPTVDIRRAGTQARFSPPDEGLSLPVYETNSFEFGATARYRPGRYFADDRQSLFGLHKVQWSIEPGVYAEAWFMKTFRARAEVRYGFNGYEGFVGDLSLDWVPRVDRFTFSIGPRIRFGDSDFTQAYFGVSPAEAAINGRVTPYKPGGGLYAVGALGTVSYAFSEQWSTTVYAGYERLVGDAGRSPIPRNLGSRDQFSVGAGVSYSFAMPSILGFR